MTRRRRTTLQRAALFEGCGGVCHICGEVIDAPREAWELDHRIPYELTRDDSDENLAPAHDRCHRDKTRDDVAVIAKARRVAAKHKGAKAAKRKIPGSRGTGLRKKMNGTVMRVKE